MKEHILVNVTPQETRVATISDGVVQDLHIERSAHRGIVGDIYLGIVKRVLPGMQSAFIEIGLDRAAFLHVADLIEQRQNPNEPQRIERLLHEGQPLVVQVIKDPIGTKGARLSTQISIAGRFLVFLPQDQHIGISQRIEEEAERNRLRLCMESLLIGEHQGYIVRTSAEHVNDDELKADIDYLNRIWADIRQKTQTLPAPSRLFQDLSLQLRVLRDIVNTDTDQVLVDSRENFQRMSEFAGAFVADVLPRIKHYSGERPLFELYGIEAEIEKALSRRVNLKFGGYLIIDQTEAMTTIDVNTGAFVGHRNFDDTIFKTNLEATHVIARQLRLRNLGGIIIVDFIDMDNEDHRNSVLEELQKGLASDRTRITVSSFTSLGLIEITRKRTRESLAHILCEPCPTCQGRGEIKTAQTVCYEVMREILREARQFNAREYRILASQTVIDMLLDEESTSLAELADFIGKSIYLQVESTYSQEQYDVILM